MTREDIIRMAREAYLDYLKNHARNLAHLLVSLRAIDEEREACVKVFKDRGEQ